MTTLRRWFRRRALGYRACSVPTCEGERRGWTRFCSRHVKPILDGVETLDDYKAWLEVQMHLYRRFDSPDDLAVRFWPPNPYHPGELLKRYQEECAS